MLLIICGKSGSGKDALLKRLVQHYSFTPIISTTSRPPRFGEMDGVAYNFVTKEMFLDLIHRDRLIEYRTYNTLVNNIPDTWYYGIEKRSLQPWARYVVILDITGTQKFLEYFGKENCCVVYINVSDDVRTLRAKNRGSFDECEWNRRLDADANDFSEEMIKSVNAYTVENNDLFDDTVEKVFNYYRNYNKFAQLF